MDEFLHPEWYQKIWKRYRSKLTHLQTNLENNGYIYKVISSYRSPAEQAKLWRQGRSTSIIQEMIQYLHQEGASYLANIIESVGPQYKNQRVTNAIPGQSWHNFDLATDFWFVKTTNEGMVLTTDRQKYLPLATQARRLELESGYFWKSFPDLGHVQLYKDSPLKMFKAYKTLSEELEKSIFLKKDNI